MFDGQYCLPFSYDIPVGETELAAVMAAKVTRFCILIGFTATTKKFQIKTYENMSTDITRKVWLFKHNLLSTVILYNMKTKYFIHASKYKNKSTYTHKIKE